MANDKKSDSAPTVRMVGSDGESYDVPKDVEDKAFALGYRRERSILETALDVGADSNLLSAAYEHFTGNEPAAGAIAARYGQQVVIGPDKQAYTVPASNAAEALKLGYRLPADTKEDRVLVARAEASIDPSNEGGRGAIKTMGAAARNEFAKTATFGLLDPEKDLLTDEQRARFEQAKEMNPVSSGAGSVLGFAGGIVADPLSIGGLATKAGAAAEKRLVGEGASLGRRVLGGAAKGAVEGAIVSAPVATRNLIEADPAQSAEAVLIGVGAGALLRGGGRFAGAKAGAALEKGLTYASEHSEDIAGKGLGKVAKAGLQVVGLAKGPVGFAAGTLAGEALENTKLAEKAGRFIKRAADRLLEMGPTLDSMATAAADRAAVPALNALSQLVGAKEDLPKDEAWKRAQERLTDLQADPKQRAAVIADMTSALPEGHPARDAVALKTNGALSYLYSQMPKEPTRKGMFRKDPAWVPSDAQLASFQRKVQVVMDPFAAIDELKRGTLTSDHVDALANVYPAFLAALRGEVTKKAAHPKAPNLTKAQRNQVALLLGQPLDDSTSPSAIAQYQALYGGQSDGQGGIAAGAPSKPIKVDGVPNNLTPSQRIAARDAGMKA